MHSSCSRYGLEAIYWVTGCVLGQEKQLIVGCWPQKIMLTTWQNKSVFENVSAKLAIFVGKFETECT